jgi:hypothetical protein
MKGLKHVLLVLCLVVAGINYVQAKTDKFGTWIELEFRKDFLKQFSFSISPELRFQDQFNLDEYMIQGKLEYEPFRFLSVAGSYRLGKEIKKKDNLNYNRFALDVQADHDIERFNASLRTRFTNSSDSEQDEPGRYFRPRVKLDYNIKGNKITPFVSYELFHNLSEKELSKARFDIGFTRNINKLHRIGLYYRLQDYFSDKGSVHIAGLEYRLRF